MIPLFLLGGLLLAAVYAGRKEDQDCLSQAAGVFYAQLMMGGFSPDDLKIYLSNYGFNNAAEALDVCVGADPQAASECMAAAVRADLEAAPPQVLLQWADDFEMTASVVDPQQAEMLTHAAACLRQTAAAKQASFGHVHFSGQHYDYVPRALPYYTGW